MTWRQVTGDHQHRTPAEVPKCFQVPVAWFCEFNKFNVDVFGILPMDSENFLDSENLVCDATSSAITALSILQIRFN